MMPGTFMISSWKRRGIETLDLLVCCNQHLAGLMAALLHPRLLILDMIPRHTNFHEPADEIADLPVAAMAGIGVCDNERPEVDRVRGASLLFAHARPGEILVLVRGEQSANNGRSLVREPGSADNWPDQGRDPP